MAYISATELSLILPANVSIGTNTMPLNLGEVASVIAEVGARFDSAAAGAGYALPIDASAAAYPLVQQIVKDGAACRVLRILFPALGGGPAGGPLPLAEDYCAAYAAAIAMLEAGDLALPGVGETTSEDTRLLARSWSTSSHD